MSIDFGLIQSIHNLLKQAASLRERIEAGPRRIARTRTHQSTCQQRFEQAKQLEMKTRMAADAKQLQLSEREAKIKDLEFRLNTCDSNKEFQLLKERIAADLQANSVLQDEILELLERIDDLHQETGLANQHLEAARQATETISEEVRLELDRLKIDLAEVESQLATREKQLSGDIRSEYLRSVKRLGEDVFGESDFVTCGNCQQNLTTQVIADLRMFRSVYCKNCGCLLYVKS